MDGDGQQLRKRKYDKEQNADAPEYSKQIYATVDKENVPNYIYNITFNNCSEVNYQLPEKTRFA